ncbi:hypothetical protein AHAS_Ahas05G0179000 [Arachis hypogaea]
MAMRSASLSSFKKPLYLWNLMIRDSTNNGFYIETLNIYTSMVSHTGGHGNTFTYPLLLKACANLDSMIHGTMIHGHILRLGFQDDLFVQTALVGMYAKCTYVECARHVFDGMAHRSVVSWNSMISAYSRGFFMDAAFSLLKDMWVLGFEPSSPTFVLILSACADIGSISIAQEMEDYISLNGLEFDLQVQTSLIHLYSKCGSIKKAQEVFEKVADKDLTVWSSMINSYAIHGMGKEAIDLFRKMTTTEGIIPDAIVYTSVLLACSHAGLVEDGLKYFISMQKDFGITPKIEHCTCLVDLLGRVSRLDLALDTIQGMPLEAQVQAWAPLLSACRIHGNVELGEITAVKLLDLSPGSFGNYVLMANLYTSFGKWKEAHAMRKLIDGKGLVKECGWSQVEIGGGFHTFAAGNPSRVQLANIYKMLEDLNFTLQEGRYAGQADLSLSPSTDVISFSPNEETKEALIIVRDFTINNNDASVFLDAQHCCIMKTSLDYLSSLSANDGLSGAMRALISETATVFAHCSSSYIEANMKIESTASELSRADNLKSDLENNKNQFNDMVASEKELRQKLARLEEMKKELEKQIRTTNANIMASRKELNTTRKRKRGVYVEGKALKAQMDVKEKVPCLQHDLAKEN